MAVAVTPVGQRAFSASDDRSLRLWNLEDGAELAAFHADAAIQCCAVSQDKKRTVAGDALGRIHVLDIQRLPYLTQAGRGLRTATAAVDIHYVAFERSG